MSVKASKMKCSVLGCNDRTSIRHRFPKVYFTLWIQKCSNPSLNGLTYTSLRSKYVCHKHFTKDNIMLGSTTRLRKDAIPTLFLPSTVTNEHTYCKTVELNEDSSNRGEDNPEADKVARDIHDLIMDLTGDSQDIPTEKIDLNLALQSSELVTLNDPIAGNWSRNEVPPDYSNQIDVATNNKDTTTQTERKKTLNSIKILANDGTKVDVCRTCLKMAGNDKINVFDTNNTFQPCLEEMIRFLCPGINLKMYDNPMICVECKNNLQKFYEFKQAMLLAEERLNKYANGCVATTNKKNVNLVILPAELNAHMIIKNDRNETNKIGEHPPMPGLNIVVRKPRKYLRTNKCPKQKRIRRRTKVRLDKPLGPFLCEYCGKVFEKVNNYRRHAKRRHGSNSKMRDLTCPICKKEILNVSLKRHMRLHSKPKPRPKPIRDPIQCNYCDKKFLFYGAYNMHQKTHFLTERRYQCHICGREYKLRTSLRIHLLGHAPSDFKHECHICHKKFLLKGKLKDHIETHSDMSYVCNICNRHFRKEVSLNRHVDVSHMNLGRYYCVICDKAFYDLFRLKLHMKRKHDIVFVNSIDEQT